LVAASGELVHVSADENSELLWALRGGGGGAFGIVVSIALRVHPAPPQMVSLSCAWPLSSGGKRVGEPIVADWHSRVMPALPDQWQTYTVAMKSPLGPKVPGWNYFTMNGLLVVEGLYNGPWSQNMLDSVKEVLDLGKEHQLKCELANFSSFNQWHDQAWFASEGPVDFRVTLASSFAQANFDHVGHSKLIVDTVMALPVDAVNMMFGVQLGGKVAKPDSNASVSANFRNAVFFQENDADWNFAWADKQQMAWTRQVGDAMAALDGFSGSYMNEPDASKPRGVYEDLFWGNATFSKLQTLKRKWDTEAMFDCPQCVHN
jgi:FAD/FMN-containing dehydrogenase